MNTHEGRCMTRALTYHYRLHQDGTIQQLIPHLEWSNRMNSTPDPTDYNAQLEKWWNEAEEGIPSAGDTVIFDERHRGLGFHVTQATKGHPRGYDNARILAHAPKPTPAWHDAVAVIAHKHGDYGLTPREVFQNVGSGEWGSTRYFAKTEDLVDPVPLIEAKVTDEMVKRGLGEAEEHGYIERVFGEVDGIDQNAFRAILTAALGLEAE